ncbi:MAG: peptidylprolyl isomerase [Acidobacteriota bacterium]|nr:peptidylprolyl isomerase [Acidobacteriota bacterium]
MKSFKLSVFASTVLALSAQTPPAPSTHAEPGRLPPIGPAHSGPALLPAVPADPNKVILTIGNEKITEAQYDKMVAALPEQIQTSARGPGKRQFVEQLIRLKLLSREAEKRKLDQKPVVQQQLAFQRDNLLAGALYQDLLDNAKVDDAAARKYYDDHKSEYEQVKARHILVRAKGSPSPASAGGKELTDEEALAKAQDLRKKLVAGADFAELAKTQSDDTGSGANGGDLGLFKHGQMVPPFEQAAFSLPIGQISEPVKTPFGYHIIKVEQKESKTFDEVRPEIEKKLRPELAKTEVEDLRKNANVIIDDSFFGPAPVVPPPPPVPAVK